MNTKELFGKHCKTLYRTIVKESKDPRFKLDLL